MLWTNSSFKKEDALLSPDAPDQVVLFDVLPGVHPSAKDDVPDHKKQTMKELITEWTYRYFFALVFVLQCYVNKTIAAYVFGYGIGLLSRLGLTVSSY